MRVIGPEAALLSQDNCMHPVERIRYQKAINRNKILLQQATCQNMFNNSVLCSLDVDVP